MQYLRNRNYDPYNGRFTQEDPIGLAGGLNLYGFAHGDPVNFSDPFGLCPPPGSCQLMAMMARWAGTTSDGPSNDRIAQLEPEVAIRANLLMNISEHVNGDALRVTHGYRSVEEQDALYAQGRTAPGEIVTNARGGESEHNFGRAFDVAFKTEGGGVTWTGDWHKVGAIGTALGLTWGGNWRMRDMGHFELPRREEEERLR